MWVLLSRGGIYEQQQQPAAMDSIVKLLFFCAILSVIRSHNGDEEGKDSFSIEGKVDVTSSPDKEWLSNTRVLVDGGDYLGFIKNDGSFVISGVPSGSYVIEISNPTYLFESARVDITSKGKIRARRVNNVQPSMVKTMPYPLEFRDRGMAKYFMVRDQLRIKDVLFSPMMMMMFLPLVLVMFLPKMMNTDPETKKEMEAQMSAFTNRSNNMPDMAEMLSGFFGGGSSKNKAIKSKSSSSKKGK